jgi:hypothetical protein
MQRFAEAFNSGVKELKILLQPPPPQVFKFSTMPLCGSQIWHENVNFELAVRVYSALNVMMIKGEVT